MKARELFPEELLEAEVTMARHPSQEQIVRRPPRFKMPSVGKEVLQGRRSVSVRESRARRSVCDRSQSAFTSDRPVLLLAFVYGDRCIDGRAHGSGRCTGTQCVVQGRRIEAKQAVGMSRGNHQDQ